MAISKDLEPLIFKKISARRQPWWCLEEFDPPNLECVPTPLSNTFHQLFYMGFENIQNNHEYILNAHFILECIKSS
jgi:hypothetical protein